MLCTLSSVFLLDNINQSGWRSKNSRNQPCQPYIYITITFTLQHYIYIIVLKYKSIYIDPRYKVLKVFSYYFYFACSSSLPVRIVAYICNKFVKGRSPLYGWMGFSQRSNHFPISLFLWFKNCVSAFDFYVVVYGYWHWGLLTKLICCFIKST